MLLPMNGPPRLIASAPALPALAKLNWPMPAPGCPILRPIGAIGGNAGNWPAAAAAPGGSGGGGNGIVVLNTVFMFGGRFADR